MDEVFARHPKWTMKLGKVATGLTNGDHGGVEYTVEGVRYLRGQAVSEFGLDLSKDQRFIAESEHKRMIRAEVAPGDVLFTIAGSIGNACVVCDVDRANINQAIVRMRPLPNVLPQYLADFLNTSLGRLQSRRVANGGVQLNINFSEVKALKLLVPPLDVQENFVSQLATVRAAYLAAMYGASRLLDSIDAYLLSEFEISLPEEESNTIQGRMFATRSSFVEHRLDPAYFSRRFTSIETAIRSVPHVRLATVAKFSGEQWDQVSGFSNEFPYLEISSIDTETGEISSLESIAKDAAPSRARMVVRTGDLLISTTRPNRGAIALVSSDLKTPFIASTGFAVLREIKIPALSKEFLAILLRSKLCLLQFEQRSSGGNYPAIGQAELGRVLLPIPDESTQARIIAHVENIKQMAKRLRQKAEIELATRKSTIESVLIGDVE